MNMRLHPGLWKTFFDPHYYRFVAAQGCGWGLRFIALFTIVLIMCGVLFFIKPFFEGMRYFKEHRADFIEKFPALKLENGTLHVDKPLPYEATLLLDENTEFKIRFVKADTIQDFEKLQEIMEKTHTNMLVTSKQIITIDKTMLKIRNVERFPDFSMDRSDIEKTWKYFPLIIFISIFLVIPFLWIGYFVYFWIITFILSLFGLLASKIFKTKLRYEQVFRLCAFACWPALVLDFVSEHIGMGFVGSILLILYPVFAIWVQKKALHPASVPHLPA